MSGARALHGGELSLACEVRRLAQAVADWENRQAQERAASIHKEAQRLLGLSNARDRRRQGLMRLRWLRYRSAGRPGPTT